uniref:N(2)-fixation sustaining protein CowN n=1 Tax=Dechloromonas aromatica (strain RCB) TaxID=159087 RepID=COWN_DECAR|nr:RecName: Full=N(2)-fixation sustaining protein CowN; AltName: Full=CO weal-nitrogenase [Dechloromonas aromatica RCB]
MPQDCACRKTDRYVSFQDIDCTGNARRLMEHLDRQLSIPGRSTAFWEYFAKKRAGSAAAKPDDLFLIHSNINQFREFFEQWNDSDALSLLLQIEEECC